MLCTNPAALGGGAACGRSDLPEPAFRPWLDALAGIKLLDITQPMPSTVWSTEPGSYSAKCSTAGGASVLQLTALHGAQVAKPSPDATWGLHLLDANIALGNLIELVKTESAAFVAAGR